MTRLLEAGHIAFMNGVEAATRAFAAIAIVAAVIAAVAIPSKVGKRSATGAAEEVAAHPVADH